MLTTFCPGYVTGRCGIHFTSWSLPAAIRLPVNVKKPRITSTARALMRKGVIAAVADPPRHKKNSAVPTRPAASPPNACDNAVRWGTAVSGMRDNGTPTANPSTIAPTIQP